MINGRESMKFLNKTTVRKIGNAWRVVYYFPYSGIQEEEFTAWNEAFGAALDIEYKKQWA